MAGFSAWPRMEHLDGDVAAEVGVASLEDDAHPAAGDLAEDLVAHRPAGGKGLLPGPDHRRRRSPARRASKTRDVTPVDCRRASRTPRRFHAAAVDGGPKAARRAASRGASGSSSRDDSARDRRGRSWQLALAILRPSIPGSPAGPFSRRFFGTAARNFRPLRTGGRLADWPAVIRAGRGVGHSRSTSSGDPGWWNAITSRSADRNS